MSTSRMLNIYSGDNTGVVVVLTEKKIYKLPTQEPTINLPYNGGDIWVKSGKKVYKIPGSLMQQANIHLHIVVDLLSYNVSPDYADMYFSIKDGSYIYYSTDGTRNGVIDPIDFSSIKQKYWDFINNLIHPLSIYKPPDDKPMANDVATSPVMPTGFNWYWVIVVVLVVVVAVLCAIFYKNYY